MDANGIDYPDVTMLSIGRWELKKKGSNRFQTITTNPCHHPSHVSPTCHLLSTSSSSSAQASQVAMVQTVTCCCKAFQWQQALLLAMLLEATSALVANVFPTWVFPNYCNLLYI